MADVEARVRAAAARMPGWRVRVELHRDFPDGGPARGGGAPLHRFTVRYPRPAA